jgi:hypothetical protein
MILAQVLLPGAAFVVALFYFGYGATRGLLPPHWREWQALVTPFVGMALIIVWDYVALFFGINLTAATVALFVVVTVVNGVAVWRKPLPTLSPVQRGRSHEHTRTNQRC